MFETRFRVRLIIAVVLFFGVLSLLRPFPVARAQRRGLHIDWVKTWARALEVAADRNVPVFITFHQDG
jgi:hypothetical protein